MSCRMCELLPGSRTGPGSTTRDTSTTPRAIRIAWVRNGQADPTANRNAPSGGPPSWYAVRNPACSRALPMPRSLLLTSIGSRVRVAAVLNASAVPMANMAINTEMMFTVPLKMVPNNMAITRQRNASPTITRRRRSNRSASAPAHSPNNNCGRRSNRPARATRNALSVCEATSNGPAATAMPSPMLATQDEASSQRKPMPNRSGMTAWTTAAHTFRTRAR